MASSYEIPQTLLQDCPFEYLQSFHPAKGSNCFSPEQNSGYALNQLHASADPNFHTQSSLLPMIPILLLDMYSIVVIIVQSFSQVTSSSLASATSNHSIPTQYFSSVATQYEAVTSGEKQKMRSTKEMLKCGIRLRSQSSSKSTEEMKNLKVSVLQSWPVMKKSSSLPNALRQSRWVQFTFLDWNGMLAMEHFATDRQRASRTRRSVLWCILQLQILSRHFHNIIHKQLPLCISFEQLPNSHHLGTQNIIFSGL